MVHNTIQDNEKIKKLEQIHMTRGFSYRFRTFLSSDATIRMAE